MIIQCDKCQTKYRIDDSRVRGRGVKVRCTKCQNIFIVTPPEPEREMEEPSPPPPQQESRKEAEEREGGLQQEGEGTSEMPGTSEEESPGEERREEEPSTESPYAYGEMDFGGGESTRKEQLDIGGEEDEEKGGVAEESGGLGAYEEAESSEAPSHFESTEPFESSEPFGSFEPSESPTSTPESPLTEDTPLTEPPPEGPTEEPSKDEEETYGTDEWERWDIGNLEEGTTEPEKESPQKEEGEAPPPPPPQEEEKREEDEKTITFSIGVEEGEERTTEKIPEEDESFDFGEERSFKVEESKGRGLGLVLAFLLVIAGGVALYLSGGINTIMERLAPPQKVQRPMEIEDIKGVFTDTKELGRIFYIKARIRNLTDQPQKISGVRGTIYNTSGAPIASHTVSPGRILTEEELKTLPKQEIILYFKDLSGGVIPPKGTIPVMVVFTNIPEGMAEFGLEVIR